MNQRQERFVHAYLKDPNATQAAIKAGYSKKTAGQIGGRLLKDVQIRAAVEKAQAKLVVKCELTLESHLEELAKIRDGAKAAQQYSAANAAEANRGKVCGLYVERFEDVTKLSPAEKRERLRTLLMPER